MSDGERVSAALRWSGRLLAVAGVVLGMLPQGGCGSGFFPDAGDDPTGSPCSEVVSGPMTGAVVLLALGVAVMIAGQIMGWRNAKARS